MVAFVLVSIVVVLGVLLALLRWSPKMETHTMPNELYFYTTPPSAAVTVTLDNGTTIQGSDPMTANGRSDAHLVQLPPDTGLQGSNVRIDGGAEYVPFDVRGLVVPSTTGEAKFQLDDVRLEPRSTTPPPTPQPPDEMPTDPLGIINHVYASGLYELETKKGCGEFTEACALALYTHNHPLWGHIKKEPGQNQWNGHATDAVQCLGGTDVGIWDIIQNSESVDAKPAYNYKGPADPSLWMPPTGAPSRQMVRPWIAAA